MLYFSLFLAGFMLGIFAALKVFRPELEEELWDPQHLPVGSSIKSNSTVSTHPRPSIIFRRKQLAVGK